MFTLFIGKAKKFNHTAKPQNVKPFAYFNLFEKV
jgi:hypothetical protein